MENFKKEIKLLINGDLSKNIEGYKGFLQNNGINIGFELFKKSNGNSYKDFLNDKINEYEKKSNENIKKNMILLLNKLLKYDFNNKNILPNLNSFQLNIHKILKEHLNIFPKTVLNQLLLEQNENEIEENFKIERNNKKIMKDSKNKISNYTKEIEEENSFQQN